MNHIYRLVWNVHSACFVAVAENVRSHGKSGSAIVGAALLSALVATSTFHHPAWGADISIASGNTRLFTAPNGVQAVDIATANAAGLSHNKYNQFNVDSRGLILNNNSPQTKVGAVTSQLGGQIVPNVNLNAEARIILNEVVAASRSVLAGYMEVAGGKADVIVANPWGITCSGCGFINSDRGTLTTGVPNVGADGSLIGFRVNQGDILISGDGLDARNQNILDLVARSVKFDAQVNAKDLQVVAGSNDFDYVSRNATPIAGSGAAPTHAIDSSALGGMYANRIRLIATENGVGVRMLGEAAASADDFTLNAAGKIEIRSKVSAERDLALTTTTTGADAIALTDAQISARRNLALTASSGGATLNGGFLVAGNNLTGVFDSLADTSNATAVTDNNKRFAAGTNTLTVTHAAAIDGATWGAGGKLSMTLGSLNVGAGGATLYSGADTGAANRDLEIVATSGDLDLSGIDLKAGGNLTLGGASTDNFSLAAGGSLKAGGNLNISANTAISNAGTWLAGGGLTLTAADSLASLSNSGSIQAGGVLTLGEAGHLLDITNQSGGAMLGDTLAIQATGASNSGTLQASNGSSVTAASFSNVGAGSKLLLSTNAGHAGSLNLTGAFANAGFVQSAGALSVTAGGALTNSGSVLALRAADGGSDAALALTALTISNSGLIDTGSTLTATVTSSAGSGDTFVNSGAVQGSGNLVLSVGNRLWNQAGGKIIGDAAASLDSGNAAFTVKNDGLIQSDGNLSLGSTLHLASLDNAAYNAGNGLIRTDASLSFTGGSLVNAGVIQAKSGTTANGSSLSNTGVILASSDAGADGSLTFSGAIDNQGTLQSAGGLAITGSSTLNNAGTLKASGSSDSLTASATTLTNSGFIEAGDVLSLVATSTSGTTLNNSGQIHSVGSLAISSGGDVANTGSGTVIGDTAVSLTTGQSSFGLTNAGRIQSGASLTMGTAGHVVALTNQAGGIVHAGGTLALSGDALANAGTVQATAGATVSGTTFSNTGAGSVFIVSTSAGDDGSLTFSGAIDNQGTLQSAGGLAITGSSTLNNSGTLKASGSSDSLTASATTLTNFGFIEAGDVLSLVATSTSGTTLNNSGQIHSVGSLAISSGGDVANTGSVIGDTAVSLTTGQTSFGLTNAGRIQSGASLTLGGAGHVMALTNQAAGVAFAGSTLNLTGGALDNQGKIYANTGATMSLASLANGNAGNSSALIFGAMSAGSSSINVSGGLDNYGAIHSNDSLGITAAGITNYSSGGLSSITTLGLTSSGANNINNAGALYAGTALNLTASGGSITNSASTGTIDSGGTFTSNSVNFTNNNTVVTTGNINITTSGAFVNETTLAGGAITKSLGSPINVRNLHEANRLLTEGGTYNGADIKVTEWEFDREESLNGITTAALLAQPKAQIIANGAGSSLTINYGGSGRNYIAVISAPTVNIGGTGTFTNEDLALYRQSYVTQMIEVHDDYVGAGSGKKLYEFWGRNIPGASYSTSVNITRDEWGEYNPNDNVGDWSVFNHGNTSETWTSAQTSYNDAWTRSENSGAVLSGAVTTQPFGAGIYASNFNFTSGTLSNVGSPWPNSPTQAKAGPSTTGTLASQSQASGSTNNAAAAGGGSGSSASTSSSVGGAGSTGAGSKNSVVAGSSLSFAGLSLTLPANPNGYFVPSRNPAAQYLVETNPLFTVGSNFVGSNYLAERYGFNPDTVQKRLGDSNYEAYLIRQQLIQQTNSNVIKGYGDEASQMKRLMTQAIEESLAYGAKDGSVAIFGRPGAVTVSQSQGFAFGKELSAEQITGLKKDIVWMVEVEVAGQKVLAPRVYLAQSTRDKIISGAAIVGDNVNIAGDALNNTGGTIQGSDTLKVSVKGDITNTSGNIQGGDVSLTSTEGSIVNQTMAVGAGNDTQYETAIGKTAGITSTGKMDLTAEKNITVVGADIDADGGLDMLAGEKIEITEIVDKTIKSSSSTTIDAENFLISDDTTTTNSTKTTNKGKGSSVTVGTPEQKLALEKARTDLQAQEAKTSAARKEVVEINDRINKDPSSIARAEVSAKIKAALKSDADALLALLEQIDPKPLPEEPPVVVEIPERTVKEELAYRKLTAEGKIAADAARAQSFRDKLTPPPKKEVVEQATLSPEKIMELKKEFNTKLAAYKLKEEQVKDANPMPEKSVAVVKLEADRQVKIDAYKTMNTEAVVLQAKLDETLKKTGGLNVKTEQMVVKGSGITVAGNAKFNVDKDIQILSGTDTESETSTKVKKAYFTTDSHDAGGSAAAGTHANAEAGHKSNVEFASTETTTTNKSKSSNVASVLDIGGNLDMKAGGNLKIQGSDVNVLGDASLEAKDVQILTGVNTETESTKTNKVGVGLYNEGNASANAAGSMEVQQGADASASGGSTLGVRTTNSEQDHFKQTNRGSTIKVGGNLDIKAEEKATFVGANVTSGGDMNIDARNIENLAAQDIERNSSHSTRNTAGIELGASADARAASSRTLGIKGVEAGASANAEGTLSLRDENVSSNNASGSVTQVTNTFQSGGNFSRNAKDTILDQGTSIEAGGDISHSAKTIRDEAVSNSKFSSSDETSHDARIGLYAGAGASAQGEADIRRKTSSSTGTSASIGVKASYQGEFSNTDEQSSTAVTSRYKAGGSITSTSSDKTTLTGTQFEAGKDVTIQAGSLDYKAAEDTRSKASVSDEVNVSAKASIYGTPGVSAHGDYDRNKDTSESTTARTGSISAGGNLTIKTTSGDANFTGTDLNAKGNTLVDSAGKVNFDAAMNSSESYSQDASARLDVAIGGGKKSGDVAGGYSQGETSTTTSKTSNISGNNITIKGKDDVTLQGSNVTAKNQVSITSQEGEVNLKRAENSSDNNGFGGGFDGLDPTKRGSNSGGFSTGANYEDTASSSGQGVTIQSGGGQTVSGKRGVNVEKGNYKVETGVGNLDFGGKRAP